MQEVKRGCGYRKVGSLYLVGEGLAVVCDRLPFYIKPCECCGFKPSFTRGLQRIPSTWLVKGLEHHHGCTCGLVCPICNPLHQDYALMWVGAKFYTPRSFVKEAEKHGVSKCVSSLPNWLELNKTWVLLAYQKVPIMKEGFNVDQKPAVFYAFKPRRVEKLIWKSQAKPKVLRDLEKRGITPVIIEDGDTDHMGA